MADDTETNGSEANKPSQDKKPGQDKKPVTFESLVQIISAVIGSTLIVTALTSLSSVINNPDMYLNIQPQISAEIESGTNIQPSPVSSYQIIARNDGRTQATNVTLSMFIRANINHWTPILHSEQISKSSTIKYENWSLQSIDLPRFTSGAVIIIRVDVTNATIVTPYFVSAAYDQGSNQYPNFLPADIQEGRFPDIMAGRSDPIQLVIIISLILSALAFAVTLVGIGKLKEHIGPRIPINKNNIIWFAPVVILSSVFLLYVFEEVPRNLLISSLILNRPADVTTGLNIFNNPEGSSYNQGTLLLGAFAFCGISWFARGFVGYLIIKKIISKLFHDCNNEDKLKLNKFMNSWRFGWLSYFLVGTPFYSFIVLFLPKSTEGFYSASLFMIFLLFEICRFLILTLVIPKLFLRGYIRADGRMRTDFLYYPLIVFSMLIAITHFILVISLLKAFTTNYEVLVSTQDLLWPTNLIMIFCVIIGTVQVFIGSFVAHYFISHRKETRQLKYKSLICKLGIASIISVWFIWICIFIYVTSYQPAILRAGVPVISIGLICIILGIGSMTITLEIIKPEQTKETRAASMIE